MFRTVCSIAAALLLASACSSDPDPRLGEEGLVRFAGGGCTGSTTLAVGARVSIRLESATEDPLPGELDVRSKQPSVISAHMSLEPTTIDLQAHKQGESRIEILSSGEPFDSLVFSAKPAGLVKHQSEPRAFQGGAVDVRVTDVFGDCGENEECRLIGHSFLDWRVEPAGLGAFLLDFDGTATFRAQSAGMAQLIGREPTRSRDLVTQPLEILMPATPPTLSASLTTIPFDPSVQAVIVPLPGTVARPDAFSVRANGVLMDASTVAISRRDVTWRVQGEELVIAAPMNDSGDPFGTPFLVAGTGTVTLVASVAMLGVEQAFPIELTP
jgi:hypothetical protein